MAAKRREVDPEDARRWSELREEVVSRYLHLLYCGPDPDEDVLGAIAWRAALPESRPFDPVLRDLINRAREGKASWREVATALGEGSEVRVQSKQDWRNRQE